MTSQVQKTTLPPAQPSYIFRGHTAQIHAVHFLRQNLRLLTGDADGWVVLWSLPIKRPVVVWRPHTAAILGVGTWGHEKIVTHGRDGRVHIWQLRKEDEEGFSKTLPIDDAVTERKKPWLLHTLIVSAVNFCAFASLPTLGTCSLHDSVTDGLLIATPGVQDGSVNVTLVPAESRVATIPAPRGTKTGMLMATGLYHASDGKGRMKMAVVAGYESGHAAVFQHNETGHWECLYSHKAHSQPVLSVAVSPLPSAHMPAVDLGMKGLETGCFFTSSADAYIARHPLPSDHTSNAVQTRTLQTKHAGQQSLVIRSDGLIFATAGWDGRMRVYSVRAMKELAVLKWHKEGCYAVAFADVEIADGIASQDDVGADIVTKREMTVAEKRTEKVKATHWLAAGSKDGKVSLWEVY